MKRNQYQIILYTAKGTKIEIKGYCDSNFRTEINNAIAEMDKQIDDIGGLQIWLKQNET